MEASIHITGKKAGESLAENKSIEEAESIVGEQ